jgi:hypothetical protein
MTIQEIESACDASQTLDFTRHELEGPKLSLCKMFYPFGFPVEVRTNSQEILCLFNQSWGCLERRFNTDPIEIEVLVTETESTECPPAPLYRMMQPLLICTADAHNYSVYDLDRNRTKISVSSATLRHKRYLKFFFLDAAAGAHIATRYGTPIHAGCVSLDGRGVLLCGDSGAGKSSLSYACARAGWSYIADDCSFLLNGSKDRTVIGDSRKVRLRPSAAELFPEINGLKITPRATGKPSIEIETATLPDLICSQAAQVDYMVFLNRRANGHPTLQPYRKDVARYFMRQVLYGSAESLAVQYEAIEKMLKVEVLELRYSDMSWAVNRLERLLREGL